MSFKEQIEALNNLDSFVEILVELLGVVPGWNEKHAQDLINFCKDIGLQYSADSTRNATVKLIGSLHKSVGADTKAFLTDVKPALLSALDNENEKNPFQGASAGPKKTADSISSVCADGVDGLPREDISEKITPSLLKAVESSDSKGASALPKKTVKVTDSISSVAADGVDGIPREDISVKIIPTLLKALESSDSKIRSESIETMNKMLEEASKRIQPTRTGELFGALRSRLHDVHQNLIRATRNTISALASAMGQLDEKARKGILSDILKCLGEDKKYMRECILDAVVSWLAAIHPDRMEQIQDLENDVISYIEEDLRGRLLSADFKKHAQKALPSMGREIAEVLDVLFRWIALRFCESSTSCLLKVDPSTLLGPSHGTTIVWIRPSPTELLIAVDSRGTLQHTDCDFLLTDVGKKFIHVGKYFATLSGNSVRCYEVMSLIEDFVKYLPHMSSNLNEVGEVALGCLRNSYTPGTMCEVEIFIGTWLSEEKRYDVITVRDDLLYPLTVEQEIFTCGSGGSYAFSSLNWHTLTSHKPIDVDVLVFSMMQTTLNDPYTGGDIRVRSLKNGGEVKEVYRRSLVEEIFKNPTLHTMFAMDRMLVMIEPSAANILSPNELATYLSDRFKKSIRRVDILWLHCTEYVCIYLARLPSLDDCMTWFDDCEINKCGKNLRSSSFTNFAEDSCKYFITYPSLDWLKMILGITSFEGLSDI